MDSVPHSIDPAQILAGTTIGIVQVTAAGRYIYANDSYCAMVGMPRADLLHGEADILTHMFAHDPASPEKVRLLEALRGGQSFYAHDGVLSGGGDKSVPVEYWVNPLPHHGEARGAVCTFIDVTDRHVETKRQELENRESSHRIRNLFAVAQALIGQTLRGTSVSREMTNAINQRLSVLSNTNSALMRAIPGNASMAEIVKAAIAVRRADMARFHIEGPDLAIAGKAAVAIALALHELCTNAAAYGALSNKEGVVAIAWSTHENADGALFRLNWQEKGGPAVTIPERKGLGSKLIVDNICSDLRGQVDWHFDRAGVSWQFTGPLAVLAE